MNNWKEYRNRKLSDPYFIAELEIEDIVHSRRVTPQECHNLFLAI